MDFQLDYHGMGAYLRGSAELNTVLHKAARNAKGRARAIAVTEAWATGAYYRSIEVAAERGDDGRIGYVVQANDPAAAAVEFGNAHTHGSGLHILRRAAEGCLP